MSTMPFVGNRINKRFQVLSCLVQLKRKGILGLFGKEIHQLSLIDLSITGIQAISSSLFNDGSKYEIAILAPAFDKPIFTKGRVVWNKLYSTNDQQVYYRIGLEFTYFKNQSWKKIKHLECNPLLREIK